MDINSYGGMPGLAGPNAMGPDAVMPPAPLAGGGMTPQQRQLLAMMLMGRGGGTQTAGNVAIPQGLGGVVNGAMQAYAMKSMMGM